MKRYRNIPPPEILLRLFVGFVDPAIEARFKHFYTNFYYRFAQVSLGLGLVLVIGDFIVDHYSYPEVSANIFRLTFCAPILIAALGYSFHSHARKHWETVMSTMIVLIAFAMFWVLLRIDDQGGQGLKSWVGILNFTILELYCFVILGARFRHAFPSGLIVLIGFEYAMYRSFDGDLVRVGYLSYHAITMTLISAMIGWWRELLLRKNFAAEFAVNRASERHDLERSLLEATLDASNNGILVVDNAGTITSTNTRFAQMWRIPEDLIAHGDDRKVLEFALSQLSDPRQFLAKVEQLYSKPEAISRDKLHFADGRVFSRYSHPQRLRKQVVGRVWSFLDITDQVRSEERVLQLSMAITKELENSEQHRGLVEALLQAIPDMVWMKDETGVFLSCNAAFEKLIGAPVAEVIGKRDTAFMPAAAAEEFLAHDRAAAASQAPVVYEEWVEYQSEKRMVLLETTKVAVRDKQGRLIGVLGVARDVTDIRKLMSDLEAAKNLAQNANEAKSLFLANMSHEIRTPMNAIIGMSDLALATEFNPRQRNYLQKIKQASDGLLHIINDILDFSKIEAGKMQLEQVRFELDDVFEALSGLMALRAESQGIELAYDVADHIPAILIGDSMRLRQVLTNLVSNALKFSSGGNVIVSVACQAEEDEHCELQFSVRDEGIGMSGEQVAHIFQPFTQADASTTRRFGGTGLGLAICRRIVGLLGGRIWVESKLGVGSTFHFTAKFKKEADRRQQGVKAFAEKLKDFANRPVLVVDDNPLAHKVLHHLIEQLGLQVVALNDGQAAMELLQGADCPDFLICLVDWFMPGMDGVETIDRLRPLYAQRHAPAPPMILVTAHSQDNALRRVLHHADGLLAKPVSARNLYEEVARCIGLTGAIRPRAGWRKTDGLFWPRFHSLDILLVEDMDINREVIGEMLAGVGLTVRMAKDGREALDQVQVKKPDLILMDCHMPVMDGYTATRHLRSDPSHAEIAVIALTASATVDDKRRCLAAGMNAYVTKPMRLDDLYEQMVQCLPKVHGDLNVSVDVDNMEPKVPLMGGVLPDLAGIDGVLGLAQVGGRIPLFVRVLKKFRDNLGRNFEAQFAQAIKAADWPTADRLVHSLKGISKTLGASDLADSALQLEESVGKRSVAEVTPYLAKVIHHLNIVCEGLESLDDPPNNSVVDNLAEAEVPEDAIFRLERLAVMVEGREAEAAELAAELSPAMWSSPHRAAWTTITTNIERYEYANARSALKNLLAIVKAA
ncbi:MAG: response regulator [Burkholderiales bacterium]